MMTKEFHEAFAAFEVQELPLFASLPPGRAMLHMPLPETQLVPGETVRLEAVSSVPFMAWYLMLNSFALLWREALEIKATVQAVVLPSGLGSRVVVEVKWTLDADVPANLFTCYAVGRVPFATGPA